MSSSSPIDTALERIGTGVFQRRLLLLCATGYFAVCSELLLAVFLEQPLCREFGLSASHYAWLPCTVNICSFFACVGAGKLADLYGRRSVFTVCLGLVGGAGLLCALAPRFLVLVALRSLVGVGNGGLAVADYVVFQEFAPRAERGRYLYVVFTAGCLGVLYLAALATFGHFGWRGLVVLAALPTLPAGVLRCLLVTESPHFLAAKGRWAEAHAVLRHVAQVNRTPQLLSGEEDFVRQGEAHYCELVDRGNVSSVLRRSPGRLTGPLAVIWVLQSTAYWGMTLFLPEYFVGAGLAPNLTIFMTVACEVPGCMLSALLIERLGRPWTLRMNYALAALAALSLGLQRGFAVWAKVLLACLVYFAMIPNWGVLFIFTPESYPVEMRATALGFFQTLQGIPSIFSPFLSAGLVRAGQVYMLVWGGCLLLALLTSLLLQAPLGRH